ncbi:MAG: alanine racemase [Saccharofermentanales bacterium]|jgi:alanine racemase
MTLFDKSRQCGAENSKTDDRNTGHSFETPDIFLNRSWAEVDLSCIRDNISSLRKAVRRGTEICAVVKADAYGHGVAEVVPVLLANGASRLAVSMLDEALELRQAGVEAPILVLSYTDPRRAEEIIAGNVTQTVYSRDLAEALSAAAVRLNSDVRIHIKVDTGMGRVGFQSGYEAIKAITDIHEMPRIIIEGIYTHFACADEIDPTYTWEQFERFMTINRELDRIGMPIPIKHCCNSAATLLFPEMHLDMVRPGLILYGMLPPGCPAPVLPVALKTAMTLKSNVVMVKDVPAGTSISYGRAFITERPSRIATIPIGYADGYSRRLSGEAEVLIQGVRFPQIGRICMDTCMIDVTEAPLPVATGSEVVLFGRQKSGEKIAELSVDEIAALAGTINYEVTCVVGRRMPRAYRTEEGINAVRSYLL